MRLPSIITAGLIVLSAASLWGVLAQKRQLSELQTERAKLESANQSTSAPAADVSAPTPAAEVPRELLQLRAEIARLSQQQRELSGARAQNEKLRLELENRRTNTLTKRIDSVHIRASSARWVGYGTPEDTLQSLLWAAQNRNLDKFLEALAPEEAVELKTKIEGSENPAQAAEQFFKEEVTLPWGFDIVERDQLADDSIALKIQIATTNGIDARALDTSEPLGFRQIAGQWKLSKPH